MSTPAGKHALMTTVTVSAAYGAGGSRVAPALAERLAVEFVDRAVPAAVAQRLAVPMSEALAHDDSVRSVLERVLVRFAPAAQAFSGAAPPHDLLDERSYLRVTEEVIREKAAGGDVVILGRAAAVVLRDLPGALHVRLDGPRERRIEQGMRLNGLDRDTAERQQRETDRAREAYVRQFYDVDARDPTLYHLVLNSTALSLHTCVDLIAQAVALHANPAS